MTFRTRMLSVLATAAVAVLAACGGGDSPVAPAGATLKLTNGASVPLISVNFTQCSEESWGPSRLGASETIAPGASRAWPNVGTGCWDVRVSTGSKSGYWYDLELTAGQTIELTASSGLNP